MNGDQQQDPAPTGEGGRRRVRFSRRRVLLLGGALVAGFAGTIEFFRRLAGSGQETGIGGRAADTFVPFPVRSVEVVPVTPPEDWVIRVDGLVQKPLRICHADWAGLQRRDLTARPVRGYWSKRGGYPMDAPVKGA